MIYKNLKTELILLKLRQKKILPRNEEDLLKLTKNFY